MNQLNEQAVGKLGESKRLSSRCRQREACNVHSTHVDIENLTVTKNSANVQIMNKTVLSAISDQNFFLDDAIILLHACSL